MSRYIDADKLQRHGNRGGVVYWRDIEAQPTADVRENVRGKWYVYEVANTEEEQPIAWECSECGEVVEVQYNFCPNCGADMRGDNNGKSNEQ